MGGVRSFFIGVGIVLAFLVVVGLAVAFTAYQESKPYIEKEYPTSVYSHSESCATGCTRLSADNSFGPTDGARQLRATFSGSILAAGGSLHVQVRDPDKAIVFDKTYTGGVSAQSFRDESSWSPKQGVWTITTAYTGYQGSVSLEVVSVGIPPGSL